MEIISWLNTNSGAIAGIGAMITALATVVLVIITGIYAYITKQILKESQQMRMDTQKPNIGIRLLSFTNESGHPFAQFRVENIGSGPARGIEFHDVPPIPIQPVTFLQDQPFVLYGIGYLAPGEQKTIHLGAKAHLNLNELEHKITVTYRDSRKKKYKETFSLDFRQLWRV